MTTPRLTAAQRRVVRLMAKGRILYVSTRCRMMKGKDDAGPLLVSKRDDYRLRHLGLIETAFSNEDRLTPLGEQVTREERRHAEHT